MPDIGRRGFDRLVARLIAVLRPGDEIAALVPVIVWPVAVLAALALPFFLHASFMADLERLDNRIAKVTASEFGPVIRQGVARGDLASIAANLLARDDLGLNYLTLRNDGGEILLSDGRFETLGDWLSANRARRLRSWLYRVGSADRSLSLGRDGRLIGYVSYGVDLRYAVVSLSLWFWLGLALWLLALALTVVLAAPAVRDIVARVRNSPPKQEDSQSAEPVRAAEGIELEWRHIIDALGVGFVGVDGFQRVQAANNIVGKLLGRSGEPLLGRAADELAVFTDDWGEERLSPLQRCLAGEAGPLRDTLNVGGKRVSMVAARTARDWTYALLWPAEDGDRKRKRAMAASDFAGTALWMHSEEAAALIDVEGIVRGANPALCRLLQKEEAELAGTPLVRILPDAGGALVSTDDVIKGETVIESDLDDSVRMAYRLAMIDTAGVPTYLMTLQPLPEFEEPPSEENDPLTDLPVRSRLMKDMERVWPKDEFAAACALLVVDIVDFGGRNRSLGRDACDGLIAAFARRLANTVKDVESVARLGGDEFAVLQRLSAEADDAETVARRICEAFAEPVRSSGLEVVMAVDIGLALAPDDADSPEELLRRAETALSAVQDAGDHVPRRYVPDMAEMDIQSGPAASTLRRAFARRELTLRLRPIWRRGEQAAVAAAHVEVAWEDAEGERYTGPELFAYAEKQGLANELAAWCLRTVVETYADWRDIGLTPVPLLLPMPAQAASTPILLQAWRAAETRYRVPPPGIIILPQGDAQRIAAVGPRVARQDEVDGADVLCVDAGTLRFDSAHAKTLVSAGRERGIPVIAGPLNGQDRPELLDRSGIDCWYTTDEAVVTARAFGRLIARHGANPL